VAEISNVKLELIYLERTRAFSAAQVSSSWSASNSVAICLGVMPRASVGTVRSRGQLIFVRQVAQLSQLDHPSQLPLG